MFSKFLYFIETFHKCSVSLKPLGRVKSLWQLLIDLSESYDTFWNKLTFRFACKHLDILSFQSNNWRSRSLSMSFWRSSSFWRSKSFERSFWRWRSFKARFFYNQYQHFWPCDFDCDLNLFLKQNIYSRAWLSSDNSCSLSCLFFFCFESWCFLGQCFSAFCFAILSKHPHFSFVFYPSEYWWLTFS